jgi:hypothetical protein
MKAQLILASVLFAATTFLSAEVVVLSAGTEIRPVGETTMILDSPHFLLTRADMETATLAMETVEIQKEAAERYEKALTKSSEQLLLAKRLLIVLPFAGVIAGAILDFAIRTDFFTK